MANTIDAIILASGKSERFGCNKMLLPIGCDSVLTRVVEVFLQIDDISHVIVAFHREESDLCDFLVSRFGTAKLRFVTGGASRSASVRNALTAVTSDYVLIHDGARPFVSPQLIKRVIDTAIATGSAIPFTKVTDSLRRNKGGYIVDYANREDFVAVQTPQGFCTESILKAYQQSSLVEYTDESELYGRYIAPPTLVEGEEKNKKITVPLDYLGINCRIGYGYDVHKLAPNRKLILGGIEIAHHLGLIAHSDGDVVIHAIMDAILSAIGERDIGCHFSDQDPFYSGIESTLLLSKVVEIMLSKNYKVNNLAVTILAEKPKLMDYIPLMQVKLSNILDIDADQLAINATTTEGLGIVGNQQGIAVSAVCTVI